MSDDLRPDRPGAPSLRDPDSGGLSMPRLQAGDSDLLRGAGGESAPGPGGDQGGEARSILAKAAALRFPDLRQKHGREKIDALIDHITETAILRGELEELRLGAYTNLYEAQRELSGIPSPVTKSKAAMEEFRRNARRDLAERVDGARWLVDRCSEQIGRMGGTEYDAASRAYTLLSGS